MPMIDFRMAMAIGSSVMVFLILLSIFLRHRVYERLEIRHPAVWRHLGEPSLMVFRGPKRSIGSQAFFWRGDHSTLNDPELNQQVRRMLRVETIAALLFVLNSIFYLGIRLGT